MTRCLGIPIAIINHKVHAPRNAIYLRSPIYYLPGRTWRVSFPSTTGVSRAEWASSPLAKHKSLNPRMLPGKKICLRVGEVDLSGTALPALKDGFLCVISLLSTLRKPCVTASPLFNSAKTAAAPLAGAFPLAGAAACGGGGGGGGGPPAADVGLYWAMGTPCSEAQIRNDCNTKIGRTSFRIPCQSG
jgi:hypothetical protein